MLAQPVKKMTPQWAKMRIRLELIILVFMVRCVLTNLDLQVESTSTAGVNSIFGLSRTNNRARIERRRKAQDPPRSNEIGCLTVPRQKRTHANARISSVP